jgi:hypothetical protein
VPLFIAGLFPDRGLAERVITALVDAGVPSGEISLVVRELAEEDVNVRGELVPAGDQYAALAIHSAWERLGWLGGARPAYRDKFPPDIDMAFIAAGPIAIAIGGAQLGAASGGIVGSMANFGFTLELGKQWLEEISQGRAWVMVRSTERDAAPARQVFEKYRPELAAESLRHW